jgi:hypothetical protein
MAPMFSGSGLVGSPGSLADFAGAKRQADAPFPRFTAAGR